MILFIAGILFGLCIAIVTYALLLSRETNELAKTNLVTLSKVTEAYEMAAEAKTAVSIIEHRFKNLE